MKALNLRNLEYFFEFVRTSLSGGIEIQTDEKWLVEYSIQRAEPEHNIPAEINIEAVIPVIDEGNLSDEDLLPILYPEAVDRIKTEIIEELV